MLLRCVNSKIFFAKSIEIKIFRKTIQISHKLIAILCTSDNSFNTFIHEFKKKKLILMNWSTKDSNILQNRESTLRSNHIQEYHTESS
jgi:hypothetical protein